AALQRLLPSLGMAHPQSSLTWAPRILEQKVSRMSFNQSVNSSRATFEKLEKSSTVYPPDRIARMVSKAIQSKKPKTRYVAGNARPVLFMRKVLSDKMFDRILYRTFGI